MGKTWGRLYAGTRHHRKIRILRKNCPDSWWIFYPLLELAFENDDDGMIYLAPGLPYSTDELAAEVGVFSADLLQATLAEMERLSLIETDQAGFIRLLSYSDRQYESDSSKERMRKLRQKPSKQQPHNDGNVTAASQSHKCDGNVTSHDRHGDVTVTPPEQNRTEQNKAEVHPSGCVADPASPDGDASSPRGEHCQDLGGEKGGVDATPTDAPEPEPPPSEPSQKTQPEEKLGKSPPSRFGPSDLAALWNELGCRPQVQKITDDRRKKASLRLRQRDDPEWWRELLVKICSLQAKGRHWLTFDFVIGSENNLLKIVEGNYDSDFAQTKKTAIAAGNQPAGAKFGRYSRLVAKQAAGATGASRDAAPA